MQIGISIMLAYSVFSLRLSEDVPSQSDSVHLISLYLTVCMFFSLSAMTWFAIANKLREKKRLPYWLRWLALDYISWIVFATNMQRKASRNLKQKQLSISPDIPMTSDTIPLQQTIPKKGIEYPNSYCFERDSLSTGISAKVPLLPTIQQQPLVEQSIHPTTPNQCDTSPKNETTIPLTNSSTVWIRRRLTPVPLPSVSTNGPVHRTSCRTSTQFISSKLRKTRSATKDKESLYAIHIYNRLVFLMFFLTVIIINIYTWFFYSKTVRTKLLDTRTQWSCFDESRLEIVNCSNTS